MYPRTADVSSANKIIILNQILDEIDNKLLRVRWEHDYYTSYSIDDQLTYSLPSDCKPEQIIKIMVSQEATGSIDDDTVWDTFEYVGVNDSREIDDGCYYTFIGNNTVMLVKDGAALQTTNLEIRWYYYREITAISATTDIPEVDAKYHNLLKYGLIQNCASIGDNPDATIADYWQRKYDGEMTTALKDLQDKFDTAPLKARQVEEY
jgi:hypothetical protein